MFYLFIFTTGLFSFDYYHTKHHNEGLYEFCSGLRLRYIH